MPWRHGSLPIGRFAGRAGKTRAVHNKDYLAESGSAFEVELRRMALEARKTSRMRPALQRLPSSKSVVGGVDSQA